MRYPAGSPIWLCRLSPNQYFAKIFEEANRRSNHRLPFAASRLSREALFVTLVRYLTRSREEREVRVLPSPLFSVARATSLIAGCQN
jgi:hypothetical protein